MQFLYDFSSYISQISEGLITTYDISKTTKDLDNLLNRYNVNHTIITNENMFTLTINDFNKIPDLESILDIFLSSVFNLYGWFPSSMKMENIHSMINNKKFNKDELLLSSKNLISVSIKFESKFDLIETDIPSKLYHLTIQEYERNILSKGIQPKRKSKLSLHDYDDRIYLCKTLKQSEALIPQMKLFYSEEKSNILYDLKNVKKFYNKNTKYVIFEIDTEIAGIKKLYTDPNYLGGYYYLNLIKPSSLTIIERE